MLALGLAASALMFQAQSAFAEDDFGYGYDTPNTTPGNINGDATWVYSEINTGLGFLDAGNGDGYDAYKLEISSATQPVTIFVSSEGEGDYVYARVYDSSGNPVGDLMIVNQSYDYVTVQYYATQVFYIFVWSSGSNTYDISFSGLD